MAGEIGGTLAIKWRFGGAMGGGHNPPVTLDACPCCAPASQPDSHACYWSHLKLSDDGQELKWFADHGARVADIALNSAGTQLYIANDPAVQGYNSKAIRRLDLSSGIIWSAAGASAFADGGCLAVMSNGDIVAAVNSNAGIFTPKLTRRAAADGAIVWSVTISGANITSACVDSSDNIYIAHGNPGTVEKYDSSGASLAVAAIGGGTNRIARAVATDSTNVVIVGNDGGSGGDGFNVHARAVALSGSTFAWKVSTGQQATGVAIGPNGNAVVVGDRVAVPGFPAQRWTTICYNSSGAVQWFADHGADVNGVAIDSSNNVYTVGEKVDRVTTRKYNSSGVLQWSHDYTYGYFGSASCVACDNAGNVYVGGSWIQG